MIIRFLIIMLCTLSVLPLAAQNLTYNRVFSWTNNTWTPDGVLTNSYKFDTTNPSATDISFNFTTNGLQFNPTPVLHPTVTNRETGNIPDNYSLRLSFDAPDNNTNTTFVTAQMFFQYTNNILIPGVSNLSFQLYDIDTGSGTTPPPYTSFQDRIFNVRGTNSAGQLVFANLSTTNSDPSFTITGSGMANNFVLGTNSSPNSGPGSETGTLQIDFGTNNMTFITFDYSPGPDGPANPGGQAIGVGAIYYYIIPIPEPRTYALILISTLAFFVFNTLKKRKRIS